MLKQNVTAGCSSSSIINLLYVRRMQGAPPLPSLFLFQANEEASSEENKSFLFIPRRSSGARESLLDFRIIAFWLKTEKNHHQLCQNDCNFTQLRQCLDKTNQSVCLQVWKNPGRENQPELKVAFTSRTFCINT